MNKQLARSMVDLTLSNEAIAFQDTKFFDALVEAFTKVREITPGRQGEYPADALQKIDIPAIVKAHTNMSLRFYVDAAKTPNAYVMPVAMHRNHIFAAGRGEFSYRLNENIARVRKAGGQSVGYCDRKTGRVHGYFTTVESFSAVTAGLIESSDFTAEEIAAIYLHEVGHYFTFFEYLGKMVSMNMVLATATSSALNNESYETRATILVESAKALKLKVDNVESLARIDDDAVRATTIQTVFMRAAAEKQQSGTDTLIYDERICEQAADIFATRFGAGRALATGMDRIVRLYGDTGMSTFAFCAMEAVKVVAVIGLSVVTGGFVTALVLAIFLFANPTQKLYDSGEARIRLIRQQMIEELKNQSISPEKRAILLEDVQLVAGLLTTLKDRRSLLEFVQTSILPWMRSDFKMEMVQKQLESLIANDLFVAAAKFKHGETV